MARLMEHQYYVMHTENGAMPGGHPDAGFTSAEAARAFCAVAWQDGV